MIGRGVDENAENDGAAADKGAERSVRQSVEGAAEHWDWTVGFRECFRT